MASSLWVGLDGQLQSARADIADSRCYVFILPSIPYTCLAEHLGSSKPRPSSPYLGHFRFDEPHVCLVSSWDTVRPDSGDVRGVSLVIWDRTSHDLTNNTCEAS